MKNNKQFELPSELRESKVADTAKLALAAKYLTSQPSFWKDRGIGNREKPLSNNSISKIFLSSTDIELANAKLNSGGLRIKATSTRERWLNKLCEEYIKIKEYKQIVLLGSGFDIRPLKKNKQHQQGKKNVALYATVRFWEIDQAKVLDEKESIIKQNGLDKNATYIRADYTQDDFIKQLLENGLNPGLPILIIWEGNSVYIEKDSIKQLFIKFNAVFPYFVIAFNYTSQKTVDEMLDKARLNSIETAAETLWKSGFDDIQQFADEFGLTVIVNRNLDDLENEYGVDNKEPQQNTFSICSLGRGC